MSSSSNIDFEYECDSDGNVSVSKVNSLINPLLLSFDFRKRELGFRSRKKQKNLKNLKNLLKVHPYL